MKLDNLSPLYGSMKNQGIQRTRFDYSFRGVAFDVFFMTDMTPFILGFGAKGLNFYFEVAVEKGYVIKPHIEQEAYRALIKALNLKYDPDNPFKPSAFFEDLNRHIPTAASAYNTPKPHDFAPYHRNVEEANKIYFVGWLTHNGKNNGSVTKSNIDKTKRLLSAQAAIRCEQGNISSKWTDDRSRAKNFFMPDDN